MLHFTRGMVVGIAGVKVPGAKVGLNGFIKYHIGMTWFGVYPTKKLISIIKNSLKEMW